VLGLESGADDYIVKAVKSKELIARVRARLRRTEDPVPEILQIGDVTIDVAGHSVKRDGQPDQPDPAGSSTCWWRWPANRARCSPGKCYLSRSGVTGTPADTRLVNVHVQRLRARSRRNRSARRSWVTVRGVGYKAGPA